MALIIKEVGSFIKFYQDSIEIYSFPSRDCTAIMNDDASKWILHLMTKTWIQPDNLYELALIIKKFDTRKEINWLNTFFLVEKKQYLEHVISLQQDEGLSISETLFRDIKIGVEEQTNEVNNQIELIVKGRLTEFGIL